MCPSRRGFTLPILIAVGQTVYAEIRQKNWVSSRLSRSLKMTKGETDRLTIYDVLLVIHSWVNLVPFPRQTAISIEKPKTFHTPCI